MKAETLLVRAYIEDPVFVKEISEKTRNEIRPYTRIKRCEDPVGRVHYSIVTTPPGNRVAEFLLIQDGKKIGPKKGVAFEYYQFVEPKAWTYGADESKEATSSLFGKFNIPLSIQNDWRPGGIRIQTPSFGDFIDEIDYSTDWHAHQNKKKLVAEYGFSDIQADLWSYFDTHRRKIRTLPSPDLVLWDRTSIPATK